MANANTSENQVKESNCLPSVQDKEAQQHFDGVIYGQKSSPYFDINKLDQLSDTISFKVINPTGAKLSVDLFGFTNSLGAPVNPPPSVLNPALAPVGLGPTQSAMSPVNDFIYTVNQVGNSVTVTNAATNTTVTTIVCPVGFDPYAIAYNSLTNEMYVGSSTVTNVIRISCASQSIVGPVIVTPIGIQNSGLVYNSVNNSIYVVGLGGPNICEIDCTTNLSGPAVLLPGIFLQRAAFNPTQNRLYVTDFVPNNVYVIDCTNNTLTATVPTGLLGTQSIAYVSSNNSVYVCGFTSNQVVAIDCGTNIAGVPFGVTINNPSAIAYNTINNLLYVTKVTTSDLAIVSPVTNLETANIPLGGVASVGVVYDNVRNSLWMTFNTSNNIQEFAPLIPPSVVVVVSNNFDLSYLFNDLQGKPMLLKGMKMIVETFDQFINNIIINYYSIYGRVNEVEFQPLNYVSPTNKDSLIIDAVDLEIMVDGNTDVITQVEADSQMMILFTIDRSVDNNKMLAVDIEKNYCAATEKNMGVRLSGNPIYDLTIEDEANKILCESGYNSLIYHGFNPEP